MRLSSSGKWLIAAATLAVVAAAVAIGGVAFLAARARESALAAKRAAPPAPPPSRELRHITAAVAPTPVPEAPAPRPKRPALEGFPIEMEFELGRQRPVGWKMQRTDSKQQRGLMIYFEVPGHPGVAPSVIYYAFAEPTVPWSSDLRAWLSETAEVKAAQRVREGLVDYHNRPQMLPRIIGNRAALSWSAEFTRDGEPWVENLTRLFSPAGTALFFLKAPANEIDEVQSLFDIVIESTVMPSVVKTTDVASAH
jgi:hypothetical protein